MANREKGETSIVIDGKTYTLVLNTSAMAAAEDLCRSERAEATIHALTTALRTIATTSFVPGGKQTEEQFARALKLIATSALSSTSNAEVTWDVIFSKLMVNSIKFNRVLIWAMLRKYHPDIDTLDKTGDFIDRAGGMMALATMVSRASEESRPEPEDLKALGPTATRPRRAQTKRRGTGAPSTAKLAS